jgi:acetyl-CoA carboxylase/biotin carboxylase 1
VSANILAQTAEVPSIPWSGGGIKSGLNAEGVIPQDIFNSACVFTVEGAAETAEKIGYPVMIKASEGGGGKGIRMAKNIDELKTNFVQVQNEVPGSPIFMMQLCTNARHLEVQIVGDEYGNAVALNGRDCSTQRRFQKIFEEGPPIVAPREVFRQMELSAQRLTQSIGYIGAGTVEYLYNAKENKYYFLELNPRLQVEHPVTEGLTGVNLPSVQLQVAMGIPLYRVPEIRAMYGLDPEGNTPIDFLKDEYIYPDKHIIAARITAENPDEGFKPTSGRIERVKFQSTPKVHTHLTHPVLSHVVSRLSKRIHSHPPFLDPPSLLSFTVGVGLLLRGRQRRHPRVRRLSVRPSVRLRPHPRGRAQVAGAGPEGDRRARRHPHHRGVPHQAARDAGVQGQHHRHQLAGRHHP